MASSDPPCEAGNGSQMHAVSPSTSVTVMTEMLLPNQANSEGVAQGGQILAWMDLCAGITARRHARSPAITVGLDELTFEKPLKVGEVGIIKARVTRAFRTSLEIEVTVQVENPMTGDSAHCCRGFLTFVTVGHDLRPTMVRPLLPETAEERAAYDAAIHRREERLALRREAMHREHKRLDDSLPRAMSEAALDQKAIAHRAADPARGHQRVVSADGSVSFAPPPPLTSDGRRVVPAADTEIVMTEIVLPSHANTLNVTFGGQILSWMEQCARIASVRISKMNMVMASVENVAFLNSSRVGEVVTVRARVNAVFRSSLEVGVRVEAEDPLSGTWRYCNRAYFTFVLTKADRRRGAALPVIECADDTDLRRMADARSRRERRSARSRRHRRSSTSSLSGLSDCSDM